MANMADEYFRAIDRMAQRAAEETGVPAASLNPGLWLTSREVHRALHPEDQPKLPCQYEGGCGCTGRVVGCICNDWRPDEDQTVEYDDGTVEVLCTCGHAEDDHGPEGGA